MKMRFEKKKAMCREYFMWLADHLSETHELVASCNKDFSAYLIPKGTIDQLSYYGKPVDSYRLSDHWNWYSNTRKCSDPNMVQCECDEMPPARPRTEEGKATAPVFGACVAYYGEDQKYHHVYGERFDRERKMWGWRGTEMNYDGLYLCDPEKNVKCRKCRKTSCQKTCFHTTFEEYAAESEPWKGEEHETD